MIVSRIHLDHPVLREALHHVPEMEIEWNRVDMNDGREMLFWAQGGDFGAFDIALEADQTVTASRSFDVGDRRLYQVRLTEAGMEADLYPVVVETVSLVKRATATHRGWHCEFYFIDRPALERFVEACRERDVGFEMVHLHEWQDTGQSAFGLTDTQGETLVTALEAGYFEIPRAHNLQEIADRLGVSDTAASQRLRRGLSTLLERTVAEDDRVST